ncbi:MAG: hypothetical protein J6T65_06025 [Clostridia bacterium]|nr:hypothetical protein [Clostridia bacterium]
MITGRKGRVFKMRKNKWDLLLILHVLIILWAVLFTLILIFGGNSDGKLVASLAWGNFAGLFVSIPLAFISLIARANKRFSEKASGAVLVLSILCICVGVATWYFALTIMLTL